MAPLMSMSNYNRTPANPRTPNTRVIQIGGKSAAPLAPPPPKNNAAAGAAAGAWSAGGGGGAGVQARLDDASFAKYIDGFEVVRPEDLLEAKGGRVRYVIEDLDSRGNVAAKKFRLGGWLARVDPQLRFLRLFNPYAKKAWSVQLATPRQSVRLYYMPPGTSDEVAMMRKLLQQLENGDITIRKS